MFLFYSVSVGINSYIRYNSFNQEYVAKSERLRLMENRMDKINTNLEGLKNTESWELLSRVKLKMIKPGEMSFRFYDKEIK